EEKRHLSFRFYLDALMPARMAGGDDRSHTWNKFRIAMQKFPLIDVIDRCEIISPVAGFSPFIGASRIFKLAMLNEIFGIWESGYDGPVLLHRIPASMVEMQVCIDHQMDVLRSKT